MVEALGAFLKTQLGVSTVVMIIVLGFLLTADAYLIYFERKISAWIQKRYGPNRVGPWGLLQPIADGLKFLLKEDIIPRFVDKPLFILAPSMIFVVALITFAVIPWGGRLDLGTGALLDVQVASVDIGVLYLLATASLGVYGVVLGGWASNNKYSFYGAMRAAAQMLSYEIPLGVAVLTIAITSGELRLENIVYQQTQTVWYILIHPVAFFVLLVTAFAETNRAPFDLAEAEQELVGGYHTEYSAMKFALFFLAEYTHMIVNSALIVTLFLGGWHLPWVPLCQPEATSLAAAICKMAVMIGKISLFLFVYMWVRWTLPRFRFDQLMRLAWKGLVPVSLGSLTLAIIMVYVGRPTSVSIGLAGNVLIVVGAWLWVRIARPPVTGRQPDLPPIEPAWTGGGSGR